MLNVTLHRIVLCAVLLCALGLNAVALEDELIIKRPTKAGSLTLAPGVYKVKVKGSLVFFLDTKSQKSLSTVANIEKTEKKSPFTTVEGPATDTGQDAQAILLQGADFRIVFNR